MAGFGRQALSHSSASVGSHRGGHLCRRTVGGGDLSSAHALYDNALSLAVRCLDKDGVTRVRRQVMDARGRSDENSVASGEHIRGFGIEEFGEIVSHIAGKISGVNLTFTSDGERSAHITGNDRSVKLRLGRAPKDLIRDLHAIEEVCDRPDPLPEFEFITHVLPLRDKSDLAQHLDERLDAMLGTGDLSRVALAVPSECREGFDATETFRVKLVGRTRNLSELDADVLTFPLRERPVGERLSTLRKGKVQMFSDTEAKETLSGEVSALRWLTAEVTENNVHY
ncbi:TIGR04141 family sporadically distributed protein, partial [Nocardiopsis tropica]|nr:TIGR04141 family sporadically distributed protein [Nocardiopsis tropica]